MTTAAKTALRTLIRTRLLADADVAALVGARIFAGSAPPKTPFPYLTMSTELTRFDTSEQRGAHGQLTIHYHGECEGDAEGDAIFEATRQCLRPWITSGSPATLSGHQLDVLNWDYETVFPGENGERFEGGQRWQATIWET